LISVVSILFVAILATVPFIPTKKKAKVQAVAADTSSDTAVQEGPVIEEVPISEMISDDKKETEADKPEVEGDTEAEHD
jgi:hypothetical protein